MPSTGGRNDDKKNQGGKREEQEKMRDKKKSLIRLSMSWPIVLLVPSGDKPKREEYHKKHEAFFFPVLSFFFLFSLSSFLTSSFNIFTDYSTKKHKFIFIQIFFIFQCGEEKNDAFDFFSTLSCFAS